MPKNQPTAAKRARAAARQGRKFTTALRTVHPQQVLAHLDLVDTDALPAGERRVVDRLRALAAGGKPLPVRVAEPDPAVVAARARAEARGIWGRWASVEATADGYVLREIPYGPDHSGRTPAGGARVPVPVRLADGTVVVVAMPGRARVEGFDWIWEHTGWPVHTPGRIVAPPQNFSPAPGLCWEIAAWHDLARDGRVLGEDHSGGISQWQTIGWCTNRADARLVARAFTAHRGPSPFARVDVIRHGPDNGIVSRTTDTYLPAPTAPDAPEHPPVQRAEGPRPASPDRSQVPEPDWYESRHTPPNSSLMVWKGRGTGWHTLVWTGSRPGRIAEALGIGPDGPYEWAEEWRPRYPDQDLHDWTQEGRIRTGLFPKASHQERTQQIDTESRAREDALVDALASRGGLTHDQAIARLAQGGEKYRQLLDSGQAAISRALHTTRRALPQGLGRTAVRWALDDLMERHLLPENAERLAAGQLDIEAEADRNPDVSARSRRAVAEYTAPTTDPAAADIDGFRP